jgi:FkbM family methyltransferase
MLSSNFRKSIYRAIRYSPLTERVQNRLRRESGISFSEIGLFVPAVPNDVVIDAGANVGDVTSRCARTGATVHAFEPNPLCHAILKRRFARLSNVTVHHAGVMDRRCSLALSTPKAHDDYDAVDMTVGASFVVKEDDGEMAQVECVDLAEFIQSLGRVALLKMDIEGAEIPVLNHLLDTGMIDRVGVTVVETHERLSAELAVATAKLRERIAASALTDRVRLDWI